MNKYMSYYSKTGYFPQINIFNKLVKLLHLYNALIYKYIHYKTIDWQLLSLRNSILDSYTIMNFIFPQIILSLFLNYGDDRNITSQSRFHVR